MRKSVAAVILTLLVLFVVVDTRAELATEQELDRVCLNWLTTVVDATGDWGGSIAPRIDGHRDMYVDDLLVARCFEISPSGHVVVPVLKELPPVKSYSDETGINLDDASGFGYANLLRDVFRARYQFYADYYGGLDQPQPATGEVVFGRNQRQLYDLYSLDPSEFKAATANKARDFADAGPLLQSYWSQGYPYNNYCPIGDGGRTVVGCVATAFAQIMLYHQWPPEGSGTHSFYWGGDNSCGGSTPGQTLEADFSDPYDWDNMSLNCSMGCNAAEQAAVAELSYEVGVAFNMDYGACGSGAFPTVAIDFFPEHFDYEPSMQQKYRSNHSYNGWFELLKSDINEGLPIPYTISRHEIVCDGWREISGLKQVHMNYGWADSHNKWYTVDELHCDWEGCSPYVEYAIIQMRPDRGVMFDAVETLGWAPFEAQFNGSSTLEVDSWTWDFGDGGYAYVQNPTHTYQQPGVYDVTLEVDASGDVRSRTKIEYMVVLADSLMGETIQANPGDVVEVMVYARNTIPLNMIKIPLSIDGTMSGLELQSFSTSGCRTDYFEVVDFSHWLSMEQFTLRLVCSNSETSPPLNPGAGDVVCLVFSVPESANPGDVATISFDGYDEHLPLFSGKLGQYAARTTVARIEIPGGSCCQGIRGNIDGDPLEATNIVDLTFLVQYLFDGGDAPPCLTEANVNGDGGESINIVDLTFVVEYLFNGGSAPPPCP